MQFCGAGGARSCGPSHRAPLSISRCPGAMALCCNLSVEQNQEGAERIPAQIFHLGFLCAFPRSLGHRVLVALVRGVGSFNSPLESRRAHRGAGSCENGSLSLTRPRVRWPQLSGSVCTQISPRTSAGMGNNSSAHPQNVLVTAGAPAAEPCCF